jgi:Do/DeqQ family serine protease
MRPAFRFPSAALLPAAFALLLPACSGAPSGDGAGGAASTSAAAIQQAFTAAVEGAVPSVVNISTVMRFAKGTVPPPRDESGEPLPPDYLDVLEQNGGYRDDSLGTGLVLSEEGLIVTNEHVIRDADEIVVRLSDRTEYPGQVIGADPHTDIALVRIRPDRKLKPARLGDSSKLKVGEFAIAVGSPFGLESTVTQGVISATGRTDFVDDAGEDLIQTDASINPGNSGGPLLNIRGEVIGITSSIMSSAQGIGFAIPINTVKAVAQELSSKGSVRRGWLGVEIQPLTPELAESFGVKGERGVLVNRVTPRSPAERAGLRGGDIVTVFQGKKVSAQKELQRQIASTPPGTAVGIEILREGKRASVTAQLAEMEGRGAPQAPRKEKADSLGLAVTPIPGTIAKELGIDGGVAVNYVEPSGSAWQGGIREGDILLRINRDAVGGVEGYRRLVAALPQRRMVSVLVYRNGGQTYMAFRTR